MISKASALSLCFRASQRNHTPAGHFWSGVYEKSQPNLACSNHLFHLQDSLNNEDSKDDFPRKRRDSS